MDLDLLDLPGLDDLDLTGLDELNLQTEQGPWLKAFECESRNSRIAIQTANRRITAKSLNKRLDYVIEDNRI
jgi:hypothetical protein